MFNIDKILNRLNVSIWISGIIWIASTIITYILSDKIDKSNDVATGYYWIDDEFGVSIDE